MQEPLQPVGITPDRTKPNYVTPDRVVRSVRLLGQLPASHNFEDPSKLPVHLRRPVCLYWFRITYEAAHALLTNAYPRSADEAAKPDEKIMFLWRKKYGLPFIDVTGGQYGYFVRMAGSETQIRRFVADRTDDLNQDGVASDLVTALERRCIDEWMVFAPECLKTVDHIALPKWAIDCETRWSRGRRDDERSQRSALASTAALPPNASTPAAQRPTALPWRRSASQSAASPFRSISSPTHESTPPPTDLPWRRPVSSQPAAPPRPLSSAPTPNRPPPSSDSPWRRSSSSRLALEPPRSASAVTPAPPPQQTSSAWGRPTPSQPALSSTRTTASMRTPPAPSPPNAWTSRRPASSQPSLSLSTLSLADSPAVRPISTTTTRYSCKATLEQAQRVPLDRLFQLTGCKGYLVLSADAEEQTFFLETDEPRKLPLAKDVIDAHLSHIRAGETDAVKAEETVAACGNSGNKVRIVRLFDMDDLPGGLDGFKPL